MLKRFGPDRKLSLVTIRLVVRDAPYSSAPIIRDEQRPVLSHRDADWPAPDLFVGKHEACHEIFVFAGWLATVVEDEPHDLVARSSRTIPGAMQRHKRAVFVFDGEIVALVENDLQRRGMCLHKNVRNCNFAFQVGVLAFMARILVIAEEVPWPPIKSSVLHVRRILKRCIVSETIPFVDYAHNSPVAG